MGDPKGSRREEGNSSPAATVQSLGTCRAGLRGPSCPPPLHYAFPQKSSVSQVSSPGPAQDRCSVSETNGEGTHGRAPLFITARAWRGCGHPQLLTRLGTWGQARLPLQLMSLAESLYRQALLQALCP